MISAALSRRVAKARQSRVFLHEISLADYFDVLRRLSTSDAQSLNDLPADVQELVKRAEADPELNLTASVSTSFHLPGKHDQKSHGHPGSGESDVVTTTGSNVPRQLDELSNAYAAGFDVDRELGGNSGSNVELLTLSNGTRVVRKQDSTGPYNDEPTADREYLAGRVFNALGGDNVHTARVSEGTIITTFVDGPIGGIALRNSYSPSDSRDEKKRKFAVEQQRQVELPGGKEIGLLDFLINNQDRHGQNWIISNDRVEPIDQGGATYEFTRRTDRNGVEREVAPRSPFATHWLGITGDLSVESMEPKFTSDELARYRPRLDALRSEFSQGEEAEWYEQVMRRFAVVESEVRGD